jgi:DNA-binding HxlR family transcriptional regulator
MPDGADRPGRSSTARDLLGRKWTVEIVAALLARPRRFSELRAEVPGLGDTVLSRRLAELERAGIVSRRQFAEIPPRVVYSLTPAGRSLATALGEVERLSLGSADSAS